MGLRHDQPPAAGADPLDEAGDVAGFVLAILQGPLFVAEHEGAEEHLAHRIAREEKPDRALRAVELGESLEVAIGADPAGERRVAHIIEHPGRIWRRA